MCRTSRVRDFYHTKVSSIRSSSSIQIFPGKLVIQGALMDLSDNLSIHFKEDDSAGEESSSTIGVDIRRIIALSRGTTRSPDTMGKQPIVIDRLNEKIIKKRSEIISFCTVDFSEIHSAYDVKKI